MPLLDETHDPKRRSWIAAANAADADFPLQNLPFCVFHRKGGSDAPRGGVGIGDRILDMAAASRAGLFQGAAATAATAAGEPSLNHLMALGKPAWLGLRQALSRLLGSEAEAQRGKIEPHLVPIADAQFAVPAQIGDFTDFYTSIYHATNAGRMLRPDNPLMPNYKWIPIGYHSRSSSIVTDGMAVRRPQGQLHPSDEPPVFAPCRALDYETEIGVYIGAGNAFGEPIAIAAASDHIFGFTVLNDWSARDMQAWEYQPLGPFLAKSFATSISPWIVTAAALEPFRTAAFKRDAGDPAPLPYLTAPHDQTEGGFDVMIDVTLSTAKMRDSGGAAPIRLGRCNLRYAYWTVAQMLTHHASNGCNLRPGDLLGSGTLSGPDQDMLGSILEITKRGSQPMILPNGEERRFLADGDEIVMRGRAERPGHIGIGLGEARAIILPAR